MANIDTNIKGTSTINKGRNWYWWKERFRDVSRSCSDSNFLPSSLCLPIAPNQVQPGLDSHHTGHWTPTSVVAPEEELHHWTAVISTTDSGVVGPVGTTEFPVVPPPHYKEPKERSVIATFHSFSIGFISFTMFLTQGSLLGIVLKYFWEVSLPALTLNHSYSGNKILEWLLFSLLLF